MNKVMLAATLALALIVAVPAAAQPPAGEHAAAQAGEHGGAEEHGVLASLLWPTVNFAILAGTLWWFLREPISTYLHDRHESIRRDLVEAANVKAAATAQLHELDEKLKALPGEIDALKRRATDEIAADEQRIAAAAAAERERLLEQARREIALQVRLAKRDLSAHAAGLAVELASDTIKKQITPADQQRLVDRYLHDVSNAKS